MYALDHEDRAVLLEDAFKYLTADSTDEQISDMTDHSAAMVARAAGVSVDEVDADTIREIFEDALAEIRDNRDELSGSVDAEINGVTADCHYCVSDSGAHLTINGECIADWSGDCLSIFNAIRAERYAEVFTEALMGYAKAMSENDQHHEIPDALRHSVLADVATPEYWAAVELVTEADGYVSVAENPATGEMQCVCLDSDGGSAVWIDEGIAAVLLSNGVEFFDHAPARS